MKTQNDFRRRSEIAKIHVAKKQLGLTDEIYWTMILRITHGRVQTSAKMTDIERRTLLEEFRAKGFRPAPAGDARAKRAPASDPISRKIRACWLDLKNAGALDDASEAALVAFSRRMTGKDALQFLSVVDANRVIESLKQWHERVARKALDEASS